MKKRYLGILLLIIKLGQISAQPENLNFFPLGRHDGLSDESITDIVKDHEGFIWIGTANGLNRYDGNNFTVFQTSNQPKSLPDNAIEDLFISSSGDIWVGMRYLGFSRYNQTDNTFETHRLEDLEGKKEGSLFVNFCEDADSNFYVATTFGLFVREKGDTSFKNITADVLDPDVYFLKGNHSYEIFTITADEKNGIWLSVRDRVIINYNHKTGKVTEYKLDIGSQDVRNVVHSILHFNGKLWIGGLNPQFCVFDPRTGETRELLSGTDLILVYQISTSADSSMWLSSAGALAHYYPESNTARIYQANDLELGSLKFSAVTCFYEDTTGVYWVGLTDFGVNYAFKNLPFRHVFKGSGYMHLSDRNVTSLMHTRNGDLWIGYSGGIVEHHSRKLRTREIYHIKPFGELMSPGTIFHLLEDSKGNIYCTSWRGGIQKFNRQKNSFVPLFGSHSAYQKYIDGVDVRDVLEDKQGRLWLAVHGNGVYMVDEERKEVVKYKSIVSDSTSITNPYVFSLELDEDEQIWVTSAWGLSRINPVNGTAMRYLKNDNASGLSDDFHNLVTKDNEGNTWIGTDKGLNLYHKETDNFFAYTTEDGLPSDIVRGLIQDESGTYWMSTPYGIVSFRLIHSRSDRPILESVNTYSMYEGLIQDNYSINCFSKDLQGRLYFGGIIGVDYFLPEDIQPFEVKPNVLIGNIKVFGEEVYPGSPEGPPINSDNEIVLGYKQNMISIDFISLNYFNSTGTKFAYKLAPTSSKYIDLGSNLNLNFSNLQPGHYQLSLILETENGLIQEFSDILKIYIVPPFWKTDWFRYFGSLFVIMIILFSVRLFTANLRKKKVELEVLVQQRTKSLQQSNEELKQQAKVLSEVNLLLSQQKDQIESQSEELKVQSEQLAASNEDLLILNSTKDKLFSIIAHDLRNPFNIISGFTDLLHMNFDSYSDDKKKGFLQNIKDSTVSAHALLENLLNWSRSQSGRLKVNFAELSVQEIFENQEKLFKPTMLQKNLNLSFLLDEDIKVKADRDLINTVLRNLISNAYKFTPSGGSITVSAAIAKEGRAIEFVIKDSGMGIPEEDIEKIFRIDQSVSRKGTDGEGGTGLGVLLCKEFIEKMNGEIRIESVLEKGTTVLFTLPRVLSSNY